MTIRSVKDVPIVAASRGGTSCAFALVERGIRLVLIEKETFPRHPIGQSMTGKWGRYAKQVAIFSRVTGTKRQGLAKARGLEFSPART